MAKTAKDMSDITLTAYEEQRTPHSPNDAVIQLPRTALNDQLKCPVCLSIFTDTMATMECMHRFCSECISKALRWGKKECPTCRHPCPSRRSLRADKNFDKIVQVICPDRTVFEKQQEDLLERIRSHHNQKALAECIESGLRDQALLRPSRVKVPRRESRESSEEPPQKHARKKSTTPTPKPGELPTPTAKETATAELILKPHPEDPELPPLNLPYLTTTIDCTAAHLSAFVAIVTGRGDGDGHYDIFGPGDDGVLVKVRPNKSLRSMLTSHDEEASSPFTLYFMPAATAS